MASNFESRIEARVSPYQLPIARPRRMLKPTGTRELPQALMTFSSG
jgi:hypothetical protein